VEAADDDDARAMIGTNEDQAAVAVSTPPKQLPKFGDGKASSERAASVAAGQRVLSLAADAHRAPSQWDIKRATEMEQADESALREGAYSSTPMAQRLRHPELLLQQLQRAEGQGRAPPPARTT
jgi:hypothetical protein